MGLIKGNRIHCPVNALPFFHFPASFKMINRNRNRNSDQVYEFSGGSRIFPRGGREPSRGGVNTPNFPENCIQIRFMS